MRQIFILILIILLNSCSKNEKSGYLNFENSDFENINRIEYFWKYNFINDSKGKKKFANDFKKGFRETLYLNNNKILISEIMKNNMAKPILNNHGFSVLDGYSEGEFFCHQLIQIKVYTLYLIKDGRNIDEISDILYGSIDIFLISDNMSSLEKNYKLLYEPIKNKFSDLDSYFKSQFKKDIKKIVVRLKTTCNNKTARKLGLGEQYE